MKKKELRSDCEVLVDDDEVVVRPSWAERAAA